MVRPRTNKNLPDFPTTPAMLNRMQVAVLNRVLSAFDLSLDGVAGDKRNRLRAAKDLSETRIVASERV